MRFIGNKELIITDIVQLLEEKNLSSSQLTLFDAFCGTGAVSDALKSKFNIISNDMLKWTTVYTQGRLYAPNCTFEKLGFDPFEFFNSNNEIEKGFFYKNYSPAESERMYFSIENARRIDYFKQTIERWKTENLINQKEYSFLLASLIESLSCVANVAGVYGAFLKHWDSRALKPIEFKKVDFNKNNHLDVTVYNDKIENIIENVECDILYLDPPYTQNQYGTQYHILETLVLNDNPKISPITGSRETAPMRSDWSKNIKSHILFDKIIAKTKAKYILFSYSQDGFMSKSFIEASLKRYGKADTYICKSISYSKYTNFKSRKGKEHNEYLFFIEKKDEKDVYYESPLNYIGSKAKMAETIARELPEQIDCFVDAFGGGFNVGVNIPAKKIIYNDINSFVSKLVSSFKENDTYEYILFIKRIIRKFGLEKENAEAYTKVRDYYNAFPIEKRDPRLLYCVILYGFNQQIRFNNSLEFNNPVGMRWFNDKVLEKMISFSRATKEKTIQFYDSDYIDLQKQIDKETFIYFDPPYMLTRGAYNDGKRGFNGWDISLENELLAFAENLNENKKHFMISYVLEHKGETNANIQKWINRHNFNVIYVNPQLGNNRNEVLITNYNSRKLCQPDLR